MKKLIKVAAIGMMMLASQSFAGNGDLIVDGKLGVGSEANPPQAPLHTYGATNGYNLSLLQKCMQ